MNPLVLLEPETRAVETDDAALIERVREGDDRAFEALYARYHRRIAGYVRGMVGDHARAEDVTQEVFMSALRRMRATDRPIAFRPWIYQIAKNACIDHFRRASRADEVPIEGPDGRAREDHPGLVSERASPDAELARKQEFDLLRGAFGGLSESHHEILVLRELEGRSYREIGERMGLTRPAVESTLFRARRRLSEEYEELDSGRRCLRVRGTLEHAAAGLNLNPRERRRLARHVVWCRSCRVLAHDAGVAAELTPRRAGVAALMPWPSTLLIGLRTRLRPAGHRLAEATAPYSGGQGGKLAAAGAVAVGTFAAGLGAQSALPRHSDARPAPPKAVAASLSSPSAPAAALSARTLVAFGAHGASVAARSAGRRAAAGAVSAPLDRLVAVPVHDWGRALRAAQALATADAPPIHPRAARSAHTAGPHAAVTTTHRTASTTASESASPPPHVVAGLVDRTLLGQSSAPTTAASSVPVPNTPLGDAASSTGTAVHQLTYTSEG